MQDLPSEKQELNQKSGSAGGEAPSSSELPTPGVQGTPQTGQTQQPSEQTQSSGVSASTTASQSPLSQPIPTQAPIESQAPEPQEQKPQDPAGQVATPQAEIPPQPTAGSSFDPPMETPPITDQPKTGRRLRWIVIPLTIILLLLSSVVGVGVLVAYGKIPVKNRELRNQIIDIVFSIPFIPKTPEYVLKRSLLAHRDVSSAVIDASLATGSESIANIFGMQNFDMSIKGPIDFTDRKNPKASLQVQLTNQLDVELKVIKKDIYFKLNKIPTMLFSMFMMFGGSQDSTSLDPLLNKWVHYETSSLETEARKRLDESGDKEEIFDEVYQDLIDRVFIGKIMPSVKMSSEEIDGFKTHKLHLDLSGELIDEIYKELRQIEKEQSGARLDVEETGPRPSEVIENIKLSLWIDKSKYYLRKAEVQTKVDSGAYSRQGTSSSMYGSMLPSLNEKFEMALSLKLSEIGKPVQVSVPSTYISIEEFTTEALKLLGLGQIFDRVQYSQVQVGIEQLSQTMVTYWKENQRFPATLEELSAVQPGGDSVSSIVSEFQVRYRVTADGSKALLYSAMRNPADLQKPFYALLIQGEEVIRRSYSGVELTNLMVSLGMETDSELTSFNPGSVPDDSSIATGSSQPVATSSGLLQ
jgi:hypothetical protein